MNQFYQTYTCITKRWPFFLFLALLLAGDLTMVACAGFSTVSSDLVKDVNDGAVAAQDAYTAYAALNQSLTTENIKTGKLTPAKVFAAAQAGSTALNTPGLQQAVNALFSDIAGTLHDMTSKGASTTATAQAVSDQGAAIITTVSALTPAK